jgi:hypothetical protein
MFPPCRGKSWASPRPAQAAFLSEIRGKSHTDLVWVTADEIRNMGASLEQRIADHAEWLL